ncbi:nicotinate (nicotinamide) nucleotide adenylyltransferase [Pseudidiomarina sp. CB1]|uniref:nicotinate (nicotinamide) nucleotide adenylyltransferase n=1 Tax=Pseudidiomarina sp. CB1 TaxID=2972484 RepID=UPI002162652C|nr:nicotinate (nicotinamide) nucleotide adenylyltransferase [Pseudidiomarina sp. CB1]
MLRIIFGGTFDPIHNGHVTTSLAAFAELDGDVMHVMPSAQPPHRDYPGASAEQRLTMVELAYAGSPQVVAENWELKRDGPSYSLLTLREMHERWPQDKLIFLLGNDAFAKLDSWYGWQELLNYADLAVMQRLAQDTPWTPAVEAFVRTHSNKVHLLNTPNIAVSATELRAAIASDTAWREQVPPRVARFIEQQHLYGR